MKKLKEQNAALLKANDELEEEKSALKERIAKLSSASKEYKEQDKKQKVHMDLETKLLNAIDELADKRFMTRTAWIKMAIVAYLESQFTAAHPEIIALKQEIATLKAKG